jgi:predicted flap endonuclease-1-like 5' DNA nuclease
MKIIEIEGIGEKYAKKLEKEGISDVEDLLPLTYRQIKELAEKTVISIKLIDKWQEHANLMRIDGVGPEYSDVLNQVGIDSVKELARRNPQNTLDKIVELDKEKPDVIRELPTLKSIKSWINEAKGNFEEKKAKESAKMDIIEIEGVGGVYAKKLEKGGIAHCEDLLPLSKKEIKELAKKLDISEKLIDKWQEHADLIRINGIGPEYSEALNQIGIDSVKELAQRNPESTLEKLKKLDEEKPDIIRKLPDLEDIKDWIEEAKKIK